MKQPTFIPWTEEELTQLKELAGQFPAPHISAQIGRSAEGVRKQIKKLGLKSFVTTPPKPKPIASRKPSAVPHWARTVEGKPVSPIKPTTVRKASVTNVSYPPLEWCETCHSPVSNWVDHRARMGCKKTA
jgi:hypothetical protein